MKAKLEWLVLILFAIAVAGFSTTASAQGFVCLAKKNKVCTQWGSAPAEFKGRKEHKDRQGQRDRQDQRLEL